MVRRIFKFLLKAAVVFIAFSLFMVVLFRFVPVFYTPLMTIRAVENLFAGKDMVCSHEWVSIDAISPNMQKAVIAGEDARFLKHHGFDFDAIEKAMKSNEKGKKLRGGSTISQQTAKNVFLWQGRSWLRKGLETWYTVLIEVFWSKQRIMEVYLNSIEMGNGVYGVEAASHHWYRKSAADLSKREAAGITAILPNPRKFTATRSSAYIERKKSRIMAGMASVKLDY